MLPLSTYLSALALSCFFVQLAALAIYMKLPAARRWMDPVWCFLNPALYLLVIEPAMAPSLPWFRWLLWIVFAAYWTVRLFGALWSPPAWGQRAILHGVLVGSALALVRGCFAWTANEDRIPFLLVIGLGGFSLYVIPMLMVAEQLKQSEPRFAVGDRPAGWLALGLAGLLGTNLLLAAARRAVSPFDHQHAADIEAAAQKRGIASGALRSLVGDAESSRTPLGALWERFAMKEWLDDPKSHFVLAAGLADVRIGPLQLTPRETMLAIRRTGAPWTKEYREIGFDVPRVLAGEIAPLPKSEVVRRLFDETECLRLGALVIASREAVRP